MLRIGTGRGLCITTGERGWQFQDMLRSGTAVSRCAKVGLAVLRHAEVGEDRAILDNSIKSSRICGDQYRDLH